jgi:hypothetical protein
MQQPVDQPRERSWKWRRAARVTINVVLVIVIVGLIAAILLPLYVGVSPDKAGRDEFGFPRPPRNAR